MWILDCRCAGLNWNCFHCFGTGKIMEQYYIDIGQHRDMLKRIILSPTPIESFFKCNRKMIAKNYFELRSRKVNRKLQVELTDYTPSYFDLPEAIAMNYKKIKKWRLPTFDELIFVRENLYLRGIGNFKSACYLSSTQINSNEVKILNFSNGSEIITEKHSRFKDNGYCYVRFVRDFDPDMKLLQNSMGYPVYI